MRIACANPRLKFFIGDVRDKSSVDQAMADVDLVFHAAALKQVPSCEFFPMQAVQTNIIGSHNVVTSAIEQHIDRIVFLSTDKAAYPVNAMGISKAMMEKVALASTLMLKETATTVSLVRYGNVMCSRGSVIPLFIQQIKQGKPLTVTVPCMTRFLLALSEAVELVLFAFRNAAQGDLFIKKAPACTIADLAQAVKILFESDAPVQTIGIRHGEKIYETLATREELARADDMGHYYRIRSDSRDLNYANYRRYFTEGDIQEAGIEDYTSHNTQRLGVEEVVKVLGCLPEVQTELEEWRMSGVNSANSKNGASRLRSARWQSLPKEPEVARILLHTLVFPPDANSNAYIFADLAREFKEYGHQITVLTTTPHYNPTAAAIETQPLTPLRGRWLLRSNFGGIPCYHVRVPAVKGGMMTRITTGVRFHLSGLCAASDLGSGFDVVLSQPPPLSIGLISAWIAKRHGAQSIFIAQDIQPDSLMTQGRIKNPLFIRCLRMLERSVYRESDAVCGISRGIVEILRLRVPSHTLLREIPNFVNTELYRPLPRSNDFSKSHGLDSPFVISYVGNLGNAQDFTAVMAAARQCSDLNIKFLLAGGGIKEQSLREEAQRSCLTNLDVLGYQPRETTPWINASSDVCLVLLASHVRNFSFPSKIYTLMACGKPILLYGDPEADVAHFVRETGVGWVVAHGNIDGFAATVRRLCQNRDELEQCGRRGIALVQQRFTAQIVARQYHDLIEELTGHRKQFDAA